jgi:hypothetical protein
MLALAVLNGRHEIEARKANRDPEGGTNDTIPAASSYSRTRKTIIQDRYQQE